MVNELRGAAVEAMKAAYAPYSGFRVGAALEAEDGRCFVGCNVENSAYPVTVCAERVALGAAIAAGARSFTRVYIVSSGVGAASPCGSCRQALAEFGLDLEVVSEGQSGDVAAWSLRDLLPHAFVLRDGDRERPE